MLSIFQYGQVQKRCADKGSLTAYFRLRGEVSVLGLISASIELYLSLTYDFPSGKLTGTATITVKVKVLCFSKSVSITCQPSRGAIPSA